MGARTSSLESPSRPSGVDEQLWPIVCATMFLVGIVGVIIAANGDFDDDRLLFNGYTHLAGLGVAAALLIFIASRLKGAARRTAELAILLSLAWHAAAGVGAFYLFTSPLGRSNPPDAMRDSWQESDDDALPPDYHWAQDDEQQPEQAFEKAVVTNIREPAPPAAQLQSREVERATPAAEIPHAPDVDVAPLGVGAVSEPGGPLEIRRPDAAKSEEAKPPEALAIIRQKSEDLPLPNVESPVPAAMPQAPKEPPMTLEPATIQAEKMEWAKVARQEAPPNNAPPRTMTRVEVQPGESLPSPDIIARLPSQGPQTPSTSLGPEAAERTLRQGLARAIRDEAPLPSTVIPDTGPPAQPSAAAGSSPPSRLEAVSTVPVEKSDTSRAPLGDTIGSGGNQDTSRGSLLLPSRRGATEGRGKAQPTIDGESSEDPAELRAGALGRISAKACPCRRRRPAGRSRHKLRRAVQAPVPARRPGCRGPSPRWG